MASNKVYSIVKNGDILEQLKTLTAAKKLADAESAEVYSDGTCIYKSIPVQDDTATEPITKIIFTEPVVAKKPVQPTVDDPMVTKYRLKKLMNVRAKPSAEAKIMTTRPAGTIVRVLALEHDWLKLADGSFILYGNGEFAEKMT